MSTVVTTSSCPTCSEALAQQPTAHGSVWVCRKCRALACNLAVIRKIAPRLFVKHLWLAALQLGIPSKLPCPSCAQPLLTFGPDVEITPACQVCCRCFLLWFDEASLQALGTLAVDSIDDNNPSALAMRAIGRIAHAIGSAL